MYFFPPFDTRKSKTKRPFVYPRPKSRTNLPETAFFCYVRIFNFVKTAQCPVGTAGIAKAGKPVYTIRQGRIDPV